ncbi:MAG: ATP-binding protein [Synergistaceae bacterium]|nr:ATP-binding protein [Synergistaceae bacterium]
MPIIGRVIATESSPTTIEKFSFWTSSDLPIHVFDVVKVEHIANSITFGSVENISHITDSSSPLSSYISSDFGSLKAQSATKRISFNCVEVSVLINTKNFYTPVHNNAPVSLASPEEINTALGLDKIQNPVTCGSITMYAGTNYQVNLPVKLNSKYLLGPEGAHLNISGISGLAAKTSYSMFLLRAIQEQLNAESVSFVIFNVKGRDLMAIDKPNDELTDYERKRYNILGMSAAPFENVSYYIPYSKTKSSSYLPESDINEYISGHKLKKFLYTYNDDREKIELLFNEIDDPYQTTEAIISKIIDPEDSDFRNITAWDGLLKKIISFTQSTKSGGGIAASSWRKFYRLINTMFKNDEMFDSSPDFPDNTCRLESELTQIKAGQVKVIDISKLETSKQAFVFGDALKTIYNLKLGSYEGVTPPAKIIIFIDELNKYASKDVARNSPVLHELLDVAERGRSMGVILFGAEQFRSAIHPRVTGNCATNAYGRSNSNETSNHDYSNFPGVYKNLLTRLE